MFFRTKKSNDSKKISNCPALIPAMKGDDHKAQKLFQL